MILGITANYVEQLQQLNLVLVYYYIVTLSHLIGEYNATCLEFNYIAGAKPRAS
jgi:hypothetical protein